MNRVSNKSFGVLYRETLEREKTLKVMGYRVVSVWESDWLAQRYNKKEITWEEHQRYERDCHRIVAELECYPD